MVVLVLGLMMILVMGMIGISEGIDDVSARIDDVSAW